jgi:hypothetical protein
LSGLAALVRGRLPLSERTVIVGTKARILGFVAMLPGLFALGAYLYVRSLEKPVELPWMWMAQIGAIIGCALAIYLLGLRWAGFVDLP